MGINKDLYEENQGQYSKLRLAEDRTRALASLTPYRIPNGLKTAQLHKNGIFGKKISFETLKKEYQALCKRLNRDFQSMKTTSEQRVSRIGGQTIQFQPERSAWLGPFCVDFFFPQIRSLKSGKTSAMGLVIEVDGSIHNNEFKMKKDEIRIMEFSKRNILFHGINNDTLSTTNICELFNSLKLSYYSDSKSKKRLLGRLYTWTLFSHLKNNEVEKIFGLETGALQTLVSLAKKTLRNDSLTTREKR